MLFPLLEYAEAALEECRHKSRKSPGAGCACQYCKYGTGIPGGALDQYNCAVAHSVYYGLVLLDGFEAENLHGDVVAYGVLVQLLVDGEEEKAKEMKTFLKNLGIRTTLKENGCICEA